MQKSPKFMPNTKWIGRLILFSSLISPIAKSTELSASSEHFSIYEAHQGYERKKSEEILGSEIVSALNSILTLYNTPLLIAKPAAVFDSMDLVVKRRVYDRGDKKQKHVSYTEHLENKNATTTSIVWTYSYEAPGGWGPEIWRSIITLNFSSLSCVDSRAVEGYLDLPLNPDLDGAPERREHVSRHVARFATPYALPLTSKSPAITFLIKNGCVIELKALANYLIKEVDDEPAFR